MMSDRDAIFRNEIKSLGQKMQRIDERIIMLSQQFADIYRKVDKAEQFLEQARITDAKVDRILAAWVTHSTAKGGGGE
jgi:aminopeptidase C